MPGSVRGHGAWRSKHGPINICLFKCWHFLCHWTWRNTNASSSHQQCSDAPAAIIPDKWHHWSIPDQQHQNQQLGLYRGEIWSPDPFSLAKSPPVLSIMLVKAAHSCLDTHTVVQAWRWTAALLTLDCEWMESHWLGVSHYLPVEDTLCPVQASDRFQVVLGSSLHLSNNQKCFTQKWH